jgi:hypothetical protein
LTPVQVRQLEFILYLAGNNPQTVADVVKKRIDAQARQVEKLYGYAFTIDGKEVSTNDLDRILRESANPAERRKAWLASKEVGKELKDGLAELQGAAQPNGEGTGLPRLFRYQVSDYQMSSDESAGRHPPDGARGVAPLPRTAHLRPLRTGKKVPPARARTAAGRLAAQPLGPGLVVDGKRAGPEPGRQPAEEIRRMGGTARAKTFTRAWASTPCRPLSTSSRACTRWPRAPSTRRTRTPRPGTWTWSTTYAR